MFRVVGYTKDILYYYNLSIYKRNEESPILQPHQLFLFACRNAGPSKSIHQPPSTCAKTHLSFVRSLFYYTTQTWPLFLAPEYLGFPG